MGNGLAIREKERELSWIRTKAKKRRGKALNPYLPREWVGGGGGVRKCGVFFFFIKTLVSPTFSQIISYIKNITFAVINSPWHYPVSRGFSLAWLLAFTALFASLLSSVG